MPVIITMTMIRPIRTGTAMNESAALLKLMSWLSPVFPIGGFAYSAGLEQAVHAGHVTDRGSLSDWIEAQLVHGAQRNDALILVQAHRCAADKAKLAELSDLCRALCVSHERLSETVGQGTSFVDAVSHWVGPGHFPGRETPLPVAVGIAAGIEGIAPRLTTGAYLHAFVSNQLQCAIRLSVVGQDGAAQALAGLEAAIAKTAEHAANATLDDLGGAAFIADIASMNHETLERRLFLS
ncbi:urease accessory protein UreF [Hoeflea sp.]|uniref:urease accessory protein UreF n=1 Tax=Hoeflea sp. TaxID=1940281 RepID=UPI003A9347E1